MEIINCELSGTTPLLMHSDRYANPIDPLTKAHKELTGKRKKTDEDHEAIARSEWRGGLYYDDEVGLYLPGVNIEASIVGAAKLQKLGVKFKQGFLVMDEKCPLDIGGKKDFDYLSANIDKFSYSKSVVISRARIMRVRPMFREWSAKVQIAFDGELISKSDVLKALNDAGNVIGLCDWRPRFGRFSVEILG